MCIPCLSKKLFGNAYCRIPVFRILIRNTFSEKYSKHVYVGNTIKKILNRITMCEDRESDRRVRTINHFRDDLFNIKKLICT